MCSSDLHATAKDIAYHRFMSMMLVNMAQIILSFGLDYWCLITADPRSLTACGSPRSYLWLRGGRNESFKLMKSDSRKITVKNASSSSIMVTSLAGIVCGVMSP